MGALPGRNLVDSIYNYRARKSRNRAPAGPGLHRFARAELGLQRVVAADGEFAPNLRRALCGNAAAAQCPSRQDRRVDSHDCADLGDIFREAVYLHAALREIVDDDAAFISVLALYQTGNGTVAGQQTHDRAPLIEVFHRAQIRAADDFLEWDILGQHIEAAAAQIAVFALHERPQQVLEPQKILIYERLADARANRHRFERAARKPAIDDQRHGTVQNLLAPLVRRHAPGASFCRHKPPFSPGKADSSDPF